ncbi:MAG: RagB/SusD family nutrient uptake outer membrane protein [Ferruginibacter sp.]
MKAYKLFLLAILVLFTFTSCKKQLDTKPQTSLAQLTKFADIRVALLGCYQGFRSQSYFACPAASGASCGWSAMPDLMGDDFVEALESLGNWRGLSEMTYAADDGQVQALFSQPYDIISRANNVLNYLPQFQTGTNANEALQIKAQSLAIRAMVHFDLMRYFAQDFGRSSTNLGVPYITSFNALEPFANLPVRQTVKSDYDSIYADLNNALLCYRQGGDLSNNTTRNFIDSLVVHAITARVDYYASQWSDAANEATITLSLSPLGNSNDYINTFASSSEAAPPSEVYWAIPSDNTLQPGLATNGQSPNYRVSSATSSLITSLGGAYVDPGICQFNQTGVGSYPRTLCWKYPGINSFKVFRAGEMLLIKAEAEAMQNKQIDALTDLNNLRTNRGVATGSETGSNLLAAIVTLRRVELLGEGHRWFDLKRTTRTISRSDCGSTGGSSSDKCSIPASNRAWVMPIPTNDITANPKLMQNVGY